MSESAAMVEATPLKILFVINAAITGGAERHTASLADSLAARGFETAVFALRAGTERSLGSDRLFEPATRTGFFRRARHLAALIDQDRFDVVVAVNQRPLALLFAARLLARHKPPVMAILHTTLLRNRKEEAMQVAYDRLYDRADLVAFISENQRRHWLGRGLKPRRSIVVLNGIDADHFAPPESGLRDAARARLGFAEADYVIGCSAMLRTEKNHRQLIEAVARLRQDKIPACCLLIGDGPMRGVIEADAKRLGIGSHVVLAGLKADVRPFVVAFDVGVLCSTAVETLSLAALEIMSMKVPMVMSDIGGATEIVDDRRGRIVRPGDVAALTAALRVFADAEVRLAAGHAAREAVLDRFLTHQMVDAYAEAFKTLASRS